MKTMYLKIFSSLFVVGAILFMAIAAPATAADKVVYDANNDGLIQKDEAMQANVDLFNGVTTKQDAISAVLPYFKVSSAPSLSIAAVSPGTVTRSFSTATVTPGGTIIVTITPAPSSLFNLYQVKEIIPAGFNVTANTADVGTYVGNVWTFTNIGSYSFTYTLTAPAATGTYTFNGTFKDENTDTGIVTGSSIVTVTSGNLIKNPGFESGPSPWIFYTNGKGSFTIVSPGYEGNKAARVAIVNAGNNTQLYQKYITLEPKTRYRLTFAANSTRGHDLKVKLLKHVSPFTPYGLDQTFNISTSWQEFSTEFTTTGFTGTVNDGRLMFYLVPFAKAGDTYYIDDVQLEKI